MNNSRFHTHLNGMPTTSMPTLGVRRMNAPEANSTIGPALPDMANEILFEIAGHLEDDNLSFTSFLLTCRRTAAVAETMRYTSVTVWGPIGRRFLAMLLSGTLASERYCSIVRRLRYVGENDTQTYLNMALLGDVLPSLVNLHTLRIDGEGIDTAHLRDILHNVGVIRKCESPALVLAALWKGTAAVCPLTLPRLQYLRVSGECFIWSIAAFRGLRELEVKSTMDIPTFAEFIACAGGSVLGQSLEILQIKLSQTIDLELGLPMLSNAFSSVRSLRLEHSKSTPEVGGPVIFKFHRNVRLISHHRIYFHNSEPPPPYSL